MVYGLTTAVGAVRKTDVMERSAASIRLSPRELDHLGPLLNVVGDVPSKVGRRASEQGRTAEVGKLSPDLWIGESSVDLIVNLHDDFNGRCTRGADTERPGDLVTRQEIANGGHVGQRLGTRRRGHRHRAQPASLDVLDRRRHGGEIDLHLAAEKVRAIELSDARRCHSHCRRYSRRECARAASDRLAPSRTAIPLAAWQRPRPDAENFGGGGSFLNSLLLYITPSPPPRLPARAPARRCPA